LDLLEKRGCSLSNNLLRAYRSKQKQRNILWHGRSVVAAAWPAGAVLSYYVRLAISLRGRGGSSWRPVLGISIMTADLKVPQGPATNKSY